MQSQLGHFLVDAPVQRPRHADRLHLDARLDDLRLVAVLRRLLNERDRVNQIVDSYSLILPTKSWLKLPPTALCVFPVR